MYIRVTVFVALILLGLMIVQCATRGRPGGGPVDKTPPEIIYTFPASDSLGVKDIEEIQIYFSERMNESSVQKSLFISPALEYEIDWSGGDELTLSFSADSLKKDQTYVITIGSEAQDARRNKMNSSFQFAFSTGEYLDQGSISGKVYNIRKNDVMYIYAYEFTKNDTLDPRYKYAKFLTQSGENGSYDLNYLPLNKYRIFVIEDQNKNLLLDAAYEQIGIPVKDIVLDSSNITVTNLDFKMTQIDTTAPFITGARTIYNNTILVRASEELKNFNLNNIVITDTIKNDTLNLKALITSDESNSQYLLYTEQTDSNLIYRMTVTDFSDTSSNKLEEPSVIYFSGTNNNDTTTFILNALLPPDSTKNFPIFSNIDINFTLPVDTNSLNESFVLYEEQGDTLSGDWKLEELKKGNFKLQQDFSPGKTYKYILNTNFVKSIWGDTLQDTVYNHIFTTVSEDEFGSVSGRVIADSVLFSNLNLFLSNVKNSNQVIKTQKLDVNRFKIEWIPEGYYIFKGFIDLDKNKKWSPGKLNPFVYAEPTFVLQDTVRVRKRWETSGLILNLEYLK